MHARCYKYINIMFFVYFINLKLKHKTSLVFNTLAAACISGDTLPMEKCITSDTRGSQRVNCIKPSQN